MDTVQSTAQLSHYPPEELHVARGIVISFVIHVVVAGLICLILYLLGIVSLRELLEKGGAIASSGPAPEQPVVMQLDLDKLVPPPTDQIEFIKQILKPKPVPIVPKPPEPKPIPKPVVKTKPHFTAPKATGSGNTNAVSGAIAGTSGLPHPSYPYEALQAGEGGTVLMRVVFDSTGGISSAEVAGSSGVVLLDTWTRNFIYAHWKNAGLANQTYTVPVIYDPSNRTVQ